MTDAPIRGFQGEHRFLSNFWYAPIQIEGWSFPTAEHAYQAAKSADPADWVDAQGCVSPGAVKRLGRSFTLRPDWEEIKRDAMMVIVHAKFASQTDLTQRLLATGSRELIEDNCWGDTYWGVCRGQGQNHLGKILMQVRELLRT